MRRRKFKEQFFDFYFTPMYNCVLEDHQIFHDDINYVEQEYWKNIPNALVHFVETPCEVKDFNDIVDYKKKAIEISSGLRFIEIKCTTLEDA
jgi:hypothetical protein